MSSRVPWWVFFQAFSEFLSCFFVCFRVLVKSIGDVFDLFCFWVELLCRIWRFWRVHATSSNSCFRSLKIFTKITRPSNLVKSILGLLELSGSNFAQSRFFLECLAHVENVLFDQINFFGDISSPTRFGVVSSFWLSSSRFSVSSFLRHFIFIKMKSRKRIFQIYRI